MRTAADRTLELLAQVDHQGGEPEEIVDALGERQAHRLAHPLEEVHLDRLFVGRPEPEIELLMHRLHHEPGRIRQRGEREHQPVALFQRDLSVLPARREEKCADPVIRNRVVHSSCPGNPLAGELTASPRGPHPDEDAFGQLLFGLFQEDVGVVLVGRDRRALTELLDARGDGPSEHPLHQRASLPRLQLVGQELVLHRHELVHGQVHGSAVALPDPRRVPSSMHFNQRFHESSYFLFRTNIVRAHSRMLREVGTSIGTSRW